MGSISTPLIHISKLEILEDAPLMPERMPAKTVIYLVDFDGERGCA
jgi:hypothetical protein